MIQTAVWSYWEDNRQKINGGFRTKKELARCLALSLEEAKKQFKKTILITNDHGKSFLVDKYRLPFDEVILDLNKFDNVLDPELWAYVKIYAYKLMADRGEPFVHVDNDVIIWDKIKPAILAAPLFFQNREVLAQHTGYVQLLAQGKQFPKVRQDVLAVAPEYALNCGVVGANDLDFIKEWHNVAHEFIFSPENAAMWAKQGQKTTGLLKHSFNHLFEQYFVSALAVKRNIHTQVATLLGLDFWHDARHNFRYTHLWGEEKRRPDLVEKIKRRLYEDYPQYKAYMEVPDSHQHIFDDIYRQELWGQGEGSGGGSSKEITAKYRDFLTKFLKEKKIKTVADFGCGDWQFSKYVDWSGVKYDGFDCVPHIVDKDNREFGTDKIKFHLSDKVDQITGQYDLLIVKDVLIHWTNAEIKAFFAHLKGRKQFKYILITVNDDGNGQYAHKINQDINTGEFHHLDLTKPPFNVKEAISYFNWDNDPKTTYLLTDF